MSCKNTFAALLPFAATLALFAAPAASAQDEADVAQVQELIAYGPHTLKGRPGATRYSLPQTDAKGKKIKPKSKTERVYSENEAVYLFPWSEKVAAAMSSGGGVPLLRANLLTQGGAALQYSARTFTRADGSFRLRGLKPGRYVLMTEVPYKAAVTIRQDTGRTRTETSTQGFPVFQGGAQIGFVPTSSTSITSPIYRYDKAISDLKHYILKIVEVRGDAPVTDLGEVE